MTDYNYDLLIIGAGPGGYVSAIRASQLGLKTAVIEKDNPGGVCLNWGCIPSKSLISQAQKFSYLKDLENMGVSIDTGNLDYEKVYKKSRLAATKLSKGVEFLLKKNAIELIKGTAKISGQHQVSVDEKEYTAKNILIATGSRPKVIPGLEFDEEGILSSTGALSLKLLPKSILIVGAGAIGVEFAYILSSFGVQVYLVEMLESILPQEDKDVSDILLKAFKKSKVKVYTSTKASISGKQKNIYKVKLEHQDGKTEELEVEKILVAVGRTPNSDHLGLEEMGIKTNRGFIETGDYYETSVPGIYAIGDVINTPLLAHVASKEGEIAVEHMAGKGHEKRVDSTLIPGAVYTEPQVASFGDTEAKAKEAGLPVKIFVFPFRGAGKAVAVEESEGLVKLVCHEKTHEILGAHIAGKDATELIHEILLARKAELLPEDIASMIHAHPTLSEAVMEAARGILGEAIHI
ncbi:MAG: dihydrolipoamide dehydrogenase [Candidatus Marinimicrobia bacterium]|nr:dihydrolipoamide dehydrogenase [Candidatus Neomarinimicrobiota bacterium]